MSYKSKPITVSEYFEKNNRSFIKFGNLFLKELTDEEIINELAHKDLEKLAKVWKLVFELIPANSENSAEERLCGLIDAFNSAEKEDADE